MPALFPRIAIVRMVRRVNMLQRSCQNTDTGFQGFRESQTLSWARAGKTAHWEGVNSDC